MVRTYTTKALFETGERGVADLTPIGLWPATTVNASVLVLIDKTGYKNELVLVTLG